MPAQPGKLPILLFILPNDKSGSPRVINIEFRCSPSSGVIVDNSNCICAGIFYYDNNTIRAATFGLPNLRTHLRAVFDLAKNKM